MIRRIGTDDWADWRLVRARSLAEDRGAFSASTMMWTGADDTEERWRELVAARTCFVAYADGLPVGMAAGRVVDGGTELVSMWIAPEMRRRGTGRQLIESIIRWAEGRPLSLRVIDDNATAIHAYQAAGFVLQDGVDVEGCRRMVWAPPPFRLLAPRTEMLTGSLWGRSKRVGLGGVLRDTNRVARRAEVPAEAAVDGMTWESRDQNSARWWPQGITTSADATGTDDGTYLGRSVVITSWYARGRLGNFLGSRLSVIDGVDESTHGYRHVLLMEPTGKRFPRFKAVRIHAGGIVWFGEHLYVAGSSQGLRVFRFDDLIRVRNRLLSRGYRYVLPQLTAYTADHDHGAANMTYSFLSLDHDGTVPHLVAGEYGRKGGTHRLMRFPLDPETGLLRSDDRGWAVPAEFYDRQVERMQGATIVGDTWIITASAGEGVPGDLWVGRPGGYTWHRGVLPTGPEDVTHWPQRRQLWTLTEWPGRRWVFGVNLDRWL